MATNNSINTYEVPTAAGERTMPLQPAFVAYNDAIILNITGNGTPYTVLYDTEVVDQNGDYDDTTGVFTAPITGFYLLSASLILRGIAAGHTEGRLFFNYNSGTDAFGIIKENPANMADTNLRWGLNIAAGAYLTAADTISVTLQVSNGGLSVDVGDSQKSYFSAALLF